MAARLGARKTTDPGARVRQVVDGLRREITAGKVRPGDPLPLRLIADRYRVSATPVIEALIRLEQSGLVEAEAGQMARVRRVTLETIHSDAMIREAIEVQAIRLACEAATPEEIEELRGIAVEVDAEEDERRRVRAKKSASLDWEFHRRIAELSRYPAFVRELEKIAMVSHFSRVWLGPTPPAEPTRKHGILVDLIAARDVAGCDVEMRAHVHRGLRDEISAYHRRIMKRDPESNGRA